MGYWYGGAMPSPVNRPCADCGAMVRKRVKDRRPWLCLDCAAKRVADNAAAMQSKSGPTYERWRNAMMVAAMIEHSRSPHPSGGKS